MTTRTNDSLTLSPAMSPQIHALSLSWVQPVEGRGNLGYQETRDLNAYALKAWNAYPRLLAERAQLVEAMKDLFASPTGNPAADRVDHAAAWDRARALMRSLGEQE